MRRYLPGRTRSAPPVRPAGHALEREADRLGAAALARGDVPGSDAQRPAAGGAPLDPTWNAEMSQRFGHDFSSVQVFADSEQPRRINAAAFARGNELHFAPGRFAPGTSAGRRLLAHELGHVAQQATAGAPAVTAREALASIDVTKLDDQALQQRATALSTWFGRHLIDDPDYDAKLQQAQDVFREIQARAGAPATDAELQALRTRLVASSPRSAFELKIYSGELPQYRPVRNEQEQVIGYRRESSGYWEVRDIEGQFVQSGERPLETPLLDPIDLIPFELVASMTAKLAVLGARALLKAGARALAKEGAQLGAKELAKEGTELGAKGLAKEGAGLGAKGLAQVFRRGDKFTRVGAVSLKRLRNVLGRAGANPGEYKLVKVSKEAAEQIEKEVGEVVWGWVEKDGAGKLVRDAKGRPIIHFTPRAMASLEQAVKTFGHEAKHIKDFAAGMKTSSEALAEMAGDALWLVVEEMLVK